MQELKSRAGQVSIGDSFTKVSEHFRTVYVVQSIIESYGVPPHVRLRTEAGGMLMSVSAILDNQFWQRISPSPK